MNEKSMNLIFLGEFAYPQGMAGTKRIQHAVDGIRHVPDVSIRVIVLRQSSKVNVLNGCHEGIPYETVMGDLLRSRMALLFPLFYLKARCALKRAFRSDYDNIIYNYGPPNLLNVGILAYAQRLGYKIVFDIVEDYDTAMNVSSSLSHRVQMTGINYLSHRVKHLASGIIVISSHLQKKYEDLFAGEVPLHYRPISVDFDRYPSSPACFGDPATLFYGGGFGLSKGVAELIKAFDILVDKGANLRLVLTGPDHEKHLPQLLSICKNETSKKSIEYRGYLDDEEYYRTLCQADIPCIPRTGLEYAQSGFPFKLGEYLATGKPVVVSDVPDIGRLLRNRCHVVIVTPGSVESLVDGISYLLSHPDEASAIGSRGRLAAREFFDYKTQALHLHSFFQNLVD